MSSKLKPAPRLLNRYFDKQQTSEQTPDVILNENIAADPVLPIKAQSIVNSSDIVEKNKKHKKKVKSKDYAERTTIRMSTQLLADINTLAKLSNISQNDYLLSLINNDIRKNRDKLNEYKSFCSE